MSTKAWLTVASSTLAATVVTVAVALAASAAAHGDVRLPRFAVVTEPAWAPDGEKIAFVDRGATSGTVYVLNVDGSGLRRVTASGFAAAWPSWSPDGRRIAFQHATATPRGGSSEIYVVNVDGSRLRRVVSEGREPAWGPGGKRIAFAGPRYRISTVSPDGKDIRVVADPGPESGGEGSCKSDGYYEPSWSPDGEFVAFSVSSGAGGECGYDVFIGASRGFGAKVNALAAGWFEQPDWSPDSKSLALVRYPPAGGQPYYTVGIFDLRSRKPRYLRPGWHPRWSPDGSRLVFVRGNPFGPKPSAQIFIMDADGANLRQLTR